MQAHSPRSMQQRWPHSQPRWVFALKRRAPLLLATGCAFAGAAGFLTSLAYVAEDRAIRLPNDPVPQFAAVTDGRAENAAASELAASVPASPFEADPAVGAASDTGALAVAFQSQDAAETAPGPDTPQITVPEASAAGDGGTVVLVPETGDGTATPAPEVTPTETPVAATPAPAPDEAPLPVTPGGSRRTPRHSGIRLAPSGEVVDPRRVVVEDLLEQLLRPTAQVLVDPLARLP